MPPSATRYSRPYRPSGYSRTASIILATILLRGRLRSQGAGSRLRFGWARRCSMRRHGQLDHGLRDLGQLFVFPGQPPPAAKPAERPLRHPAAREEDEALAPGEAPDYDQGQPEQEAGEPVVS